MKKNILFALLLVFVGSLFSQQSRLDAFSVPYYKNTVKVKAYNNEVFLSVSYVEYASGYVTIFSLRRMDGVMGMPDNDFNVYLGDIRVSDFDFISDTVFFCGTHWDSNGVIGFFNIDTLFNAYWDIHSGIQHHPKPIYIHKGFDTRPQGWVPSLEKMTAYVDSENKRHVVCIGEARTYASTDDLVTRDCMVDFSYDGYVWSYTTGVLNHTNTNSLEAIAYVPKFLTDFIVTAGFEQDSCLTIRLYDPIYPFASPLSDKFYKFTELGSPTEGHRRDKLGVEIAPDGEGTFVTATVWCKKQENEYVKNRIHLAKFTTNFLSSDLVDMVWSRDLFSHFNFPDVTAIHGLVSNKSKESYGLLFEADQSLIGGGNSRSMFLELDGTAENLRYGLRGDGYGNAVDLNLRGLDRFDAGNKYIMAGYCLPDNYQKIVHLMETTHHASLCMPEIGCNVVNLAPLDDKKTPAEFVTTGGRVTIVPVETVFESMGIYHPCPENEDADE